MRRTILTILFLTGISLGMLLHVSPLLAKVMVDKTNQLSTKVLVATLIPIQAQATPTPTPTLTTSQLSLDFDLEAVPDTDALSELSFGGLGGGPPLTCKDAPYSYQQPTIVEGYTDLLKRTLPAPEFGLLQEICVLGYRANEAINISLINPFGEKILDIAVTAQPLRDVGIYYGHNSGIIRDYFYPIDEISTFDFLPGDPLGIYTVEISSQDTRLIHTFELVGLTEPVIYYSQRAKGHVLAGFQPFEEVRVLQYAPIPGEAFSKLIGEGRLTLDEYGVGLLSGTNAEESLIIVDQKLKWYPNWSPPLDYDKIIARDPANAYAYYQRQHGDTNQTIADLTKAVELNPNLAEAYYELGAIYASENNGYYDADLALAYLSSAIQLEPNFWRAYKERASLYEKLGQYDQAIADYSEVIRLEESGYLYYRRGHLYDLQGRKDQALADFIEAIKFDPDFSYGSVDDLSRIIELNSNLALAYYIRGKNTYDNDMQAIADLSKAIELDPYYLLAYEARASLYEKQGRYDEAIADYNTMLEWGDPSYLLPYEAKIRLYEAQGKYDQAIAECNTMIERFPHYLIAYYQRGRLYEELGIDDLALADYSYVIQQDPEAALPYYARAHLYDRHGNYDQVVTDLIAAMTLDKLDKFEKYGTINDYNRAIELNPNFALAYYLRGMLSYGSNQTDQAIIDFSKAIELAPNFAEAYFERGRIYANENGSQYNVDRAIADFKRVLELATEPFLREQAEEQLRQLSQ